MPYFNLSEKMGKAVTKWRNIEDFFCYLIALILGWSSVKSLRVTKNVKEVNFEAVWVKLEPNKITETITHRVFETNSSFMGNSAQREGFNICFARIFC